MDAPSNPAPSAKERAPRAPRPGAPAGASIAYPESVTRLIDELSRLPGIGRRSAERLTFHILKAQIAEAIALSKAIADVKQRVSHCRICYNLMDSAPATAAGEAVGLCSICSAEGRDRSTIMVIEQPKDLIALEQTSTYKGLYHVLMGRISPLEGVSAGDLTISDLLARIDDPAAHNLGVPVSEVVLALNPTLEGDGTALYLAQELERRKVRLTRLARGLPTGSQLEFASKAVLADAIQGRRKVD
jgi:recombination protein RecR